ncbi:MAG TPA: PHP domain-containing protein [bacterium]
MDNIQADLHIHSTFSDGLLSPQKIVARAVSAGLKTIAITDHDSSEGINAALEAADGAIEIIPAVEMSANIRDIDIHILGYYIDHNDDELAAYLNEFKTYRLARVKKILKKLSSDGIKVDVEQVKLIGNNGSLGRPHIAEALRQNGYVQTINEAFFRFLGYHSRYYEPKKDARPRDVIKKIAQCGGIAVAAHPGALGSSEILYQLIMDGIVGIEVWHPEHSKQAEAEYYETAMKNGLLMTGGSDFHGFPRSPIDIGSRGCSNEDVVRLKEYKKSQEAQ